MADYEMQYKCISRIIFSRHISHSVARVLFLCRLNYIRVPLLINVDSKDNCVFHLAALYSWDKIIYAVDGMMFNLLFVYMECIHRNTIKKRDNPPHVKIAFTSSRSHEIVKNMTKAAIWKIQKDIIYNNIMKLNAWFKQLNHPK